MQLFIKQTIGSLRKDLGYEEWEDIDEDALLFQQGYDGYTIEVEDGETFTIPEDSEGKIIDDSTYYINMEIFDGTFDKVEIEGDLMAGTYRLEHHLIVAEQ